jgi:hypothetical protein
MGHVGESGAFSGLIGVGKDAAGADPIADAFVVKRERDAIAGWPCGIKTVVIMHRDVIASGNAFAVTACLRAIGGEVEILESYRARADTGALVSLPPTPGPSSIPNTTKVSTIGESGVAPISGTKSRCIRDMGLH